MAVTILDSLTEKERLALIAGGTAVIVSNDPKSIKVESSKDVVIVRQIKG